MKIGLCPISHLFCPKSHLCCPKSHLFCPKLALGQVKASPRARPVGPLCRDLKGPYVVVSPSLGLLGLQHVFSFFVYSLLLQFFVILLDDCLSLLCSCLSFSISSNLSTSMIVNLGMKHLLNSPQELKMAPSTPLLLIHTVSVFCLDRADLWNNTPLITNLISSHWWWIILCFHMWFYPCVS